MIMAVELKVSEIDTGHVTMKQTKHSLKVQRRTVCTIDLNVYPASECF